ncbi:unnamed protein product [Trichogramma brassicae]|uniref:Uncharacterized protein n=1 Tax=Trichogramma brassicae TaxID=86971 RepID=A0A6H5HWU1_9HYME|nr:unnamed protein product [Trichogramma brassicae]
MRKNWEKLKKSRYKKKKTQKICPIKKISCPKISDFCCLNLHKIIHQFYPTPYMISGISICKS